MYYHEAIAPGTFETYDALTTHVSQQTGISDEFVKKFIPFEDSVAWRCEICISTNDKGHLAYCQLRDSTYSLVKRQLEDGSWEQDINLIAISFAGEEIDKHYVSDAAFNITQSPNSCYLIPHVVESLGVFEEVYHCSGAITNDPFYIFDGHTYISETESHLLFLVE